MAKYAGMVGYSTTSETRPGVWTTDIVERKMRGDIVGMSSSFNPGQSINDDITFGHRISLMGDPYAYENYMSLKYVTHMGLKLKITGVEVHKPRIIVSLGGIYNG